MAALCDIFGATEVPDKAAVLTFGCKRSARIAKIINSALLLTSTHACILNTILQVWYCHDTCRYVPQSIYMNDSLVDECESGENAE